jgi:hypothetical protein
MKTKSSLKHMVLALTAALGMAAFISLASAAATSASAIPAVVTALPAYQTLFGNETVTIHKEGLLSPTRRFLTIAASQDKMFCATLDLNRQTNRWEVAFTYGVKGLGLGDNRAMTIFHKDNRLRIVWGVSNSVDDKNLTFIKADDKSSKFEEEKYPTAYGNYFWDENSDAVFGIATDLTVSRFKFFSLDGKQVIESDVIDRVIHGPRALRKYDATTYRLWVTKSETQLATPGLAAQLESCLIHCVTLKRTATGFTVTEDKLVSKIKLPARGGLRGYFAVEDKGRTYRLILRPFPMSGEAKDQDLGEFAY